MQEKILFERVNKLIRWVETEKKLSSEEIMEKELHSRSEYMRVELILFGMVHLDSRLCTFSHMYRKRRSPFIVSPAHGKDHVSF